MNVIITGATRGIGLATAEKFAAQGASLIICARNEVQLYNTLASLQTRFPATSIKARPANLARQQEATDFGIWATEMFDGKVDVLVNNAGQFLPGSIYNETDGLLEQMMATNLYSAYHLTRAVLPAMMQQKSGHIINLCSVASLQAYPGGGSYSISKYALLGFSKNLREEMKPHGIKVTSVMPGATWTPSWDGSGVAEERIMQASDIADAIWSLTRLSPQAVVEELVIRPQLGDL
jgi:short-subunit dehydrogenase